MRSRIRIAREGGGIEGHLLRRSAMQKIFREKQSLGRSFHHKEVDGKDIEGI